MNKIYFLLLACCASFALNAQLATWTFEPDPGTAAPATVATNATAEDAEFGSSVGGINFFSGNGGGEAYAGNNWPAGEIAGDRFLDFTIIADEGFTLNVTSIDLDLRRSGSGPSQFSVLIADNLAFLPNKVYGGSLATDLTSTSFESFSFPEDFSGDTIVVRVFGFMASGSGGTLRFDNVSINGTVTELPDTELPVVSCTEFTETFSGADQCGDFIGANTPSSTFSPIGDLTMFRVAAGGSRIQTVDLSTCITDNNADDGFQVAFVSSFEENRVAGCSVDIINVLVIRDAAGNEAEDSIFFRSTIQYVGDAPMITCPANRMVDCGVTPSPMASDAMATSGCGTPTVTITAPVIVGEPGAPGTDYMYIYAATDGCGQTSICDQVIRVSDNDTAPPVINQTSFINVILNSSLNPQYLRLRCTR